MNITGAWWGRYQMPGARAVAFWALLSESEGGLTGTTSERYPPGTDGEIVNAVVRGTRAGATVAFVKAYDGAGPFAHAVAYQGTLAPGGERITGRWTIARTSAAFEMRRTLPDANEEAVERLATVGARD